MMKSPNQQPDTHQEENPTKPDIRKLLERDHSLGTTGRDIPTTDSEIQQINSLMENDAEAIAQAENENFIDEYYNVITAFLDAFYQAIPESPNAGEHAKRKYVLSLRRFAIQELRTHSKKLRTEQSKRTPLTPQRLFFKWRNLFTKINFSFQPHLNTTKMPAFTDRVSNKTIPLPPLDKATTPPPIPSPVPPPIPQPFPKTGTVLGIPIQPLPSLPISPIEAELIKEKVVAAAQPALSPATKTPENYEKDAKDYNNTKKTISDIYEEKFPVTPKEWEITMRNLQQAMANNFQQLSKNFSATNILADEDKLAILKCIANAINKIGNPSFRKRFIHEVYTLAKNVKPENKKDIIRYFAYALSKQQEYENPREISPAMEKICRNYNAPLPEKNDLTPDAFMKGYDDLDATEINNMPKEIQETLRNLHTSSQELGIRLIIMSGGISPTSKVNVAGLQQTDFETLCMQTFQQLNWLENHTQKRNFSLRTWLKPYKTAREFIPKLRTILMTQLALTGELLFSPELFVPEDIQKLINH